MFPQNRKIDHFLFSVSRHRLWFIGPSRCLDWGLQHNLIWQIWIFPKETLAHGFENIYLRFCWYGWWWFSWRKHVERRELNDFQELFQNLPLVVTVSVFIFCKTISKSSCNTILKTVIYRTLWRPKFQILWDWQIYQQRYIGQLDICILRSNFEKLTTFVLLSQCCQKQANLHGGNIQMCWSQTSNRLAFEGWTNRGQTGIHSIPGLRCRL